MPTVRRPGVPEPQADVQAELMAEAFGFYAENILTKDHFEAVLDAKLDARFAEQDTKFEKRFAEQDAKFEKRFADIDKRFTEQDAKFEKRFADQDAKFEGRFGKQDKTLLLHTWMLGVLVIVLVIPQLQAWLA